MTAYVSRCCGAGLTVAGHTTRWYVCDGCGKACDAHPVEDGEVAPEAT